MGTPLHNDRCLHNNRRHRRSNRRQRDQRRAQAHQRQRDDSQFVELLDVVGTSMLVESTNTLPQVRHESVLSALSTRANRFRGSTIHSRDIDQQQLNGNRIDDTGTVQINDRAITAEEIRREEQEYLRSQVLEEIEMRGVSDEVLTVHGTAPGSKQEGITRLLYENANGIDCRQVDGKKVAKARALHNSLEADIVAYSEHRLNYRHAGNRTGFNQLFRGGETDIRSIVAHNVHENVNRVQEGGTATLIFGPTIQYLTSEETHKDETGLGRWVVTTLTGHQGFTTRIICGYNPCGNSNLESGTVYAQHRRYLLNRGCLTCPRVKFRQDLQAALQQWREQGDRLIVCLDANEHIYKKSIGKMLTDPNGLAMKEVVGTFTGKEIGPTFFRGSKPIDGVWATSEVTIAAACVMPAGFGIGDHRMFVVDILTSSLVGNNPIRVLRPCARRLNTKLPGVVAKYNDKLENLVLEHRIIERMGEAHERSRTDAEAKNKMDTVDMEFTDYKKSAEKDCRKIKSGSIPFSPESEIWIRRHRVYTTLLARSTGRQVNRGNLIRSARRAGILAPFDLTEQEIRGRLRTCADHCEYYRDHGLPYRRRHLLRRSEVAREEGNEDGAKEILAMIARERQRDFWRSMKGAMQGQNGRSVQAVQVEQADGTIVEHTNQADIEEAIWSNIHRRRFFLAEEAPICQGQLRGEFGYSANTAASRAVLEGTYEADNVDQATQEIFDACARIRENVPANSVSDRITGEDWSRHWSSGVREETSSSESGIHFGHIIASAGSQLLSHTYATQCSIVLRRGIHLERWSRGLSVMLEKLRGCTLISKLRSILLMEADFNAANKMIYGVRMMNNVRAHNLMPDEIFSERNRTADDGTLSKVLFYDLVRQSRRPAGVSSVDADNCYDRVAHAIASLVFQAFGVSEQSAGAMLQTIQEMKFFLRTAFGDSKTAAGSTIEIKTQGLCQGNGAAPASWTVVSIAILNAHKRKGHGATFVCPISCTVSQLAAILFVDDTDVIHFRMDADESVLEAHRQLQDSVLSWGNLLIATGGSLKPAKCFYHLISFAWKHDGSWQYANNEEVEELAIVIPQPDDTVTPISHLGANVSSKTLGSMTCPSGDPSAALHRVQEKAQGWIDEVTNAGLPRRNIWFLVDHQFHPKVMFGCSTITANFNALTLALHRQYYQLLPMGGIRRSVKTEVRYLGKWFYGSGCPHLGVECLVGQLKKLLTHYGCQTVVGRLLQSSMEMFTIELGLSNQPLTEKYSQVSHWVTHSWIKSLWEKIDIFGMEVELGNIEIMPPRVGDDWLMRRLIQMGCTRKELIRLNRVRLHQQVLFLSDVLDAGGRALDRKYLIRRTPQEKWSSLTFPRECPSNKDFRVWRDTLLQLRPGGRHASSRVTEFTRPGHKVWEWRFDEAGSRLLHMKSHSMDVYVPSQVPGYGRRPNCWTRSAPHDREVEECEVICSVKDVGLAVRAICSYSSLAPPPPMPGTFWEVLVSWNCTWMWETIQLVGDMNWIADSIASGDCIAVTDGSYMRELTTEVCANAFFFENADRTCKLVGAFPERSETANAYRGELLGLMAIHLLLLAVNKVNPGLDGTVTIYSDCQRALGSVEGLPTLKIPTKYKHSDILKNILVNCSDLSFRRTYEHISAHQDDSADFHTLSRAAQLNCAVDAGAKRQLTGLDPTASLHQHRFPLEPIVCFAGSRKLTASMGKFIRFYAHKRLARTSLSEMNVVSKRQFDEIAWSYVGAALEEVPRMFQLWACKQVLGIASTYGWMSKWDFSVDALCPSCRQCTETAEHVLQCNEAGRVDTLLQTIDSFALWLDKMDTDPTLADCLVQYARGRGGVSMQEICRERDNRLKMMAKAQDIIGWRRFMEGMISHQVVDRQRDHLRCKGTQWQLNKWASGLVVRLLEITHGQWLYRNVVVHDRTAGRLALIRKERIMVDIEEQQSKGEEGLLEQHKYLLEVNLDNLGESDGVGHEYWLLAIRAARVACATIGEPETPGTLRGRTRSITRQQSGHPGDGQDYG